MHYLCILCVNYKLSHDSLLHPVPFINNTLLIIVIVKTPVYSHKIALWLILILQIVFLRVKL